MQQETNSIALDMRLIREDLSMIPTDNLADFDTLEIFVNKIVSVKSISDTRFNNILSKINDVRTNISSFIH